MVYKSKIVFFCLLTGVVSLILSCERINNDPIPDVYVRFQIDLNDIEFSPLGTLGNSVTITSETNNFGSRAAGYHNNGIIIYHSLNDGYFSFDKTCPHCLNNNDDPASIETGESFALEGVCPECGTVYSLDLNGMPTSGPGEYYLKEYKTVLSGGKYLTVWNNVDQ